MSEEDQEKEQFWTLPQVAKMLGMHRATISRLEAMNKITKARWAGPPVQGRVYSAKDIAKLKQELKQVYDERNKGKEIVDMKGAIIMRDPSDRPIKTRFTGDIPQGSQILDVVEYGEDDELDEDGNPIR